MNCSKKAGTNSHFNHFREVQIGLGLSNKAECLGRAIVQGNKRQNHSKGSN